MIVMIAHATIDNSAREIGIMHEINDKTVPKTLPNPRE